LSEGGDITTGIIGEKVIGATYPLLDFDWGVVVEWPEKEALGIVQTMLSQILQFSLIILIGILAMTFIFAQSISRPMQKIREGVKAISRGRFDYKIKIKTRDELEELSNSFNEMADSLKELSELKDEVVFIAAHELHSPVTLINMYLAMVIEEEFGKLTPETKEALEKTRGAGQRLVDLIDEMLVVAKAKGGRIEIKVSPQDITRAVLAVVADFELKAKEKNIALIYEPRGRVPKVLADSGKLKEILTNLIGNAIKCTFEGEITISHASGDGFLITSVSDTGIGMTKEELGHLFEKFYQTKTTKKRGIKGTGLGLFITKQLVEKMRGQIWAESEEGKGTTFYFSLPAKGV